MSTSVVDLPKISRGADYVYEVEWAWDCDGVETPQDVTGYTASMQFRRRALAPIELEVETGDGITVDGPAGKFTVTLTDVKTSALREGTYEFDFVITSPGGETSVLFYGRVPVRERITV